MHYNIGFKGSIKKIHIDNHISGFMMPSDHEEIRQKISLNANGNVSFKAYSFILGKKELLKSRDVSIVVSPKVIQSIFEIFSNEFMNGYEECFVTDVGDWRMIITNEAGKTFYFRGPGIGFIDSRGNNLSDIVRDALPIERLFVLDSNDGLDRIENIEVKYDYSHEYTLVDCATDKVVEIKYKRNEQFYIDRSLRKITYAIEDSEMGTFKHEFKFKKYIDECLDNFDSEYIFDTVEGNPSDVVMDSGLAQSYEIIITAKSGQQRVVKGTFDKRGLPEDWGDFVEVLTTYIKIKDLGNLFASELYNKPLRRKSDYIVCKVKFSGANKLYSYLAKDDRYCPGSQILVPVGYEDKITPVEVAEVVYCQADELPVEIGRMKWVVDECLPVY